jgi:broad specificity phosphatase PhoE
MGRIIIIRHGESEANVLGDNSDNSETKLTELGMKQAEITGKFLLKYYNIKSIYSSHFVRCKHTSKILADELKIPENNIVYTDALVEASNGILDGVLVDDIENIPIIGKKIKNTIDKLKIFDNVEVTMRDKKYLSLINVLDTLTGGESDFDVSRRTKKFIKQIKKNKSDTLIVTHNGIIKNIIQYMYNIHYSVLKPAVKNCHITVIGLDCMLELAMYSDHLL